jgi:hypothetical protein
MIDGITQRVANSEPWIARAAHLIRRDDDRFGSEATFSTMSLTPSLATAKAVSKMAHFSFVPFVSLLPCSKVASRDDVAAN